VLSHENKKLSDQLENLRSELSKKDQGGLSSRSRGGLREKEIQLAKELDQRQAKNLGAKISELESRSSCLQQENTELKDQIQSGTDYWRRKSEKIEQEKSDLRQKNFD
jgi:ABC-type phosphate transport system auxiliary subunit